MEIEAQEVLHLLLDVLGVVLVVEKSADWSACDRGSPISISRGISIDIDIEIERYRNRKGYRHVIIEREASSLPFPWATRGGVPGGGSRGGPGGVPGEGRSPKTYQKQWKINVFDL